MTSTRSIDRLVLALGAVLAVAGLVAGIFVRGEDPQQAATPGAGGSSPVDTISIVDFKYMPPQATVRAGTRLTFTNDDTAAHTATSDEAGVFDTGGIDRGARGAVTLDTPGTIAYHCDFHPFMKGTITVE